MEGLGGIPMCHPGGIDVAYDTIAKPETFEVEVRVLKARGTLVKSGVHAPGRWEWSPLYFKEISWVGSNAFGIEEVEGVRRHGIEHYLDLAAAGRVDLTGMLTHTFGLSQWQDAFAGRRRPGAQRRHQGRDRPVPLTPAQSTVGRSARRRVVGRRVEDRARTCAGGVRRARRPCHTIEPCSSRTTRSHRARAWATCCSTMSSAVPSARSRARSS